MEDELTFEAVIHFTTELEPSIFEYEFDITGCETYSALKNSFSTRGDSMPLSRRIIPCISSSITLFVHLFEPHLKYLLKSEIKIIP